MNTAVLMLDWTCLPLQPISWKRALALVLDGRAVVMEESDQVVRTVRMEIPVPLVIRLVLKTVGKRLREPALCRNSVIRRDGHMCQYCKKKFPVEDLTLDHVNPKSRGGPYIWENLVTACKPCNNKKGDRTPKEAGMPLNRKPKHPGAVIQWDVDPRWAKWLPMYAK